MANTSPAESHEMAKLSARARGKLPARPEGSPRESPQWAPNLAETAVATVGSVASAAKPDNPNKNPSDMMALIGMHLALAAVLASLFSSLNDTEKVLAGLSLIQNCFSVFFFGSMWLITELFWSGNKRF
ncbi:hypothetical protein B0T22DRAFT_246852 [Podospora appendiculata]|uniref:Uncharacterized protein n=1 Tax=Podospora appendiculata TaxID=314037 RepID=A0AAE1C8Q7_9PEZI|nr:hypothetical protein B0T22DRAFT_246852 [Podospora appendiculata]